MYPNPPPISWIPNTLTAASLSPLKGMCDGEGVRDEGHWDLTPQQLKYLVYQFFRKDKAQGTHC